MRVFGFAFACAMLALSYVGPAACQVFPNRLVRIVVPYTPGGPNDLVARMLAEKFTERWGQAVVVENKPGASGTIGADFVAKSKPDGYTLLIAAPSSTTIIVSLMPNLPFDPRKDFAPVSTLSIASFILVVNPSIPAGSVPELVALAKSGRTLSFGSGGSGSGAHLAGELFKSRASVNLTHVGYKGGVPAMTDLLGGHIDLMFSDITVAAPYVRAGKLKALGVTGPTRATAFPEVPTIAEAGLSGYEVVSWYGLLAPAGTPPEVIAALNQETRRIAATPEWRAKLERLGAEPASNTPEQFQELIARDVDKWAKVIKDSGAKAN